LSRWKPSTGTNGSQRYEFRSVSVLFNSSPQPYLFVSLSSSRSRSPHPSIPQAFLPSLHPSASCLPSQARAGPGEPPPRRQAPAGAGVPECGPARRRRRTQPGVGRRGPASRRRHAQLGVWRRGSASRDPGAGGGGSALRGTGAALHGAGGVSGAAGA